MIKIIDKLINLIIFGKLTMYRRIRSKKVFFLYTLDFVAFNS